MAAAASSFTSPVANALYGPGLRARDFGGVLQQLVDGTSAWTVAVTLFLMLVVYDQCELPPCLPLHSALPPTGPLCRPRPQPGCRDVAIADSVCCQSCTSTRRAPLPGPV